MTSSCLRFQFRVCHFLLFGGFAFPFEPSPSSRVNVCDVHVCGCVCVCVFLNRYSFRLRRATKCFVVSPTINRCSDEFRSFFCPISCHFICDELRATIFTHFEFQFNEFSHHRMTRKVWVIKNGKYCGGWTLNIASHFIFHATKPFSFSSNFHFTRFI